MDIRIDPESLYRDRLANSVGGRTEVVLTCGKIDVLTETHVYEVKHVRLWKQAMGQALVYASELNLSPAVALFGDQPDRKQMHTLAQAATSLDVDVVYLPRQGLPIVLIKQQALYGIPSAIPTPQRDEYGHVWLRLELATFEDCQWNLARDIQACEKALHDLCRMRDFIEVKFGVALSLPTHGLPTGQEPWWNEALYMAMTKDVL